MVMCDIKLAKIAYELDKMIKSGFMEWILIPNSSHLTSSIKSESSKKRVNLSLESPENLHASGKLNQNEFLVSIEKPIEMIKDAEIIEDVVKSKEAINKNDLNVVINVDINKVKK